MQLLVRQEVTRRVVNHRFVAFHSTPTFFQVMILDLVPVRCRNSSSTVAPVEPWPQFLCRARKVPVNLACSCASLEECRSCPTNTCAAAVEFRKSSLSF